MNFRMLKLGLCASVTVLALAMPAVAQNSGAAAPAGSAQSNADAAHQARVKATEAYYAAGAKYTDRLLCGTKAEQDAAKKALDAAKKDLDAAISNEAALTPEVVKALEASEAARKALFHLFDVPQSQRGTDWAGQFTAAEAASNDAFSNYLTLLNENDKRIKAEVEAHQPVVEPKCPVKTQQTGATAGEFFYDYASFKPQIGPAENQHSGGFQVRFDDLFNTDPLPGTLSAQIGALVRNSHSLGPSTNTFQVPGAVIFKFDDLSPWTVTKIEVGAAGRYSLANTGGFRTTTIDVGAFARATVMDHVVFTTDAGVYSANRFSKGFYVGIAGTYHPIPTIGVNGAVDYTRNTPFGGTDQVNYSAGATAAIPGTPLDLYARYTRTNFDSPFFRFHVNSIIAGVTFNVGGGSAPSLEDNGDGPSNVFRNDLGQNTEQRD